MVGTLVSLILGFVAGLGIVLLGVAIVVDVILFGWLDWMADADARLVPYRHEATWASRVSAVLVPVLAVLSFVALNRSVVWLACTFTAAILLCEGWFLARSGNPWRSEVPSAARYAAVVIAVVVVLLIVGGLASLLNLPFVWVW